MYQISFQNSGGELDRRTAPDAVTARDLMLTMLSEISELCDGDRFVVTVSDDED